jgi:hypothetical protein
MRGNKFFERVYEHLFVAGAAFAIVGSYAWMLLDAQMKYDGEPTLLFWMVLFATLCLFFSAGIFSTAVLSQSLMGKIYLLAAMSLLYVFWQGFVRAELFPELPYLSYFSWLITSVYVWVARAFIPRSR